MRSLICGRMVLLLVCLFACCGNVRGEGGEQGEDDIALKEVEKARKGKTDFYVRCPQNCFCVHCLVLGN